MCRSTVMWFLFSTLGLSDTSGKSFCESNLYFFPIIWCNGTVRDATVKSFVQCNGGPK